MAGKSERERTTIRSAVFRGRSTIRSVMFKEMPALAADCRNETARMLSILQRYLRICKAPSSSSLRSPQGVRGGGRISAHLKEMLISAHLPEVSSFLIVSVFALGPGQSQSESDRATLPSPPTQTTLRVLCPTQTTLRVHYTCARSAPRFQHLPYPIQHRCT